MIPVRAATASAARSAPAPTTTAFLPRAAVGVLVAVVGLATLAAAVSGAAPLLALVPVTLAALGYAIAKLPLRWSAAGMVILLLGVDDTNENVGQWRTPFAILGDLVHNRLNLVTKVPGVSVTGMEVLSVVLLLVWAQRRVARTTAEVTDRVPAPAVLRALALVSVGAVALGAGWGVLHGESWVPWKVRNLLHPVLLFLVFDVAFRGPSDHGLVARVVIASAAARALLAVVVQRIAVAQTGGKFLAATSHGDSVLFAVATLLVLLGLTGRTDRRRIARAALLLPLLLAGMLENDCRLVWIMLLLMLGVAWLVSPMRGWKRRLSRAALVAAPVIALYTAVGWDRGGRLFARSGRCAA